MLLLCQGWLFCFALLRSSAGHHNKTSTLDTEMQRSCFATLAEQCFGLFLVQGLQLGLMILTVVCRTGVEQDAIRTRMLSGSRQLLFCVSLFLFASTNEKATV
jgi:hypothetical protein